MLIMTSSAAEMAQTPAPPPQQSSSTQNSTAVTSPIMSPILGAVQSSEPQSVLVRRQFPAVVFVVLYSSPPDSIPSIQGIFMSLTNANQECRRLKEVDSPQAPGTPAEIDAKIKEERKRDIGRELERWKNAEGVECWVEVHPVVPRKWMDRGSVSSVTHPPPPKLYQNEDDDDEIVEDEDYSGEN